MTQEISLFFTAPKSGQALLGEGGGWNKAMNSLLTAHAGSERPSYAQAGTTWIDNSSSPWKVNLFDGSEDILIGLIDPAAHTHKSPPLPAHTLLMNSGGTESSPVNVSLSASTILARGASGDTGGKSISAVLDFLTSTADRMAYRGAGGWEHTALTAYARGLLAKTSKAEMQEYLSLINPVQEITGLKLANHDTRPNSLLNVTAGECWSSDQTTKMVLASTLTRSVLAAWGVEDINEDIGGMLNSNTIASDDTVHAWEITKDNGADPSIGFTTHSGTGLGLLAAHLPTDYTKFRYLDSAVVEGGNLVPGYWDGLGNFFRSEALIVLAYAANRGTSARTYYMGTPKGIECNPRGTYRFYHNSTTQASADFGHPSKYTLNTTSDGAKLRSSGSSATASTLDEITNTSGEMTFIVTAGASTGLDAIINRGWFNPQRGQF